MHACRPLTNTVSLTIWLLVSLIASLPPSVVQAAAQGDIRPASYTNDGFTNPGNANDNSPGTFSNANRSRRCDIDGVGTSAVSAEYYAFPDIESGNAPHTLVVRRYFDATGLLWGGDSSGNEIEVRFLIEYKLSGGGSWETLEEVVFHKPGSGNPTLPIGVSDLALALPSSQDTGDVRVRVTMEVELVSCNSGFNITNVVAQVKVYDIRIETCEIPSGESTASSGWNAMSGYTTAHDFTQTLTPSTVSFDGRQVTEEDPGGGGPDTCWWAGSQIDPSTSITGGVWSVNASNEWGPDTVGWLESAVTYYRNNGRAPCQTAFPQRMVISCGTGKASYLTGTLEMGFDSSVVWSERAGVYVEKTWP